MWKQQLNKLQYRGNMVEISLSFPNTQNLRGLGFYIYEELVTCGY